MDSLGEIPKKDTPLLEYALISYRVGDGERNILMKKKEEKNDPESTRWEIKIFQQAQMVQIARNRYVIKGDIISFDENEENIVDFIEERCLLSRNKYHSITQLKNYDRLEKENTITIEKMTEYHLDYSKRAKRKSTLLDIIFSLIRESGEIEEEYYAHIFFNNEIEGIVSYSLKGDAFFYGKEKNTSLEIVKGKGKAMSQSNTEDFTRLLKNDPLTYLQESLFFYFDFLSSFYFQIKKISSYFTNYLPYELTHPLRIIENPEFSLKYFTSLFGPQRVYASPPNRCKDLYTIIRKNTEVWDNEKTLLVQEVVIKKEEINYTFTLSLFSLFY